MTGDTESDADGGSGRADGDATANDGDATTANDGDRGSDGRLPGLSRRAVLAATGASALAAATGGRAVATGSDGGAVDVSDLAAPARGDVTATVDPRERFDSIVDLAAAGADRTGAEPVDDLLETYCRDDTLVVLPNGRYRLRHLSLYRQSNWGLVGLGDDVTLVPADGYREENLWIGGAECRDVWLENLTLDNAAPGRHGSLGLSPRDGLVVRDVTKVGVHDDPGSSSAFVRVLEEGGTALFDRVRLLDGGENTGVYCDSRAGETVFRDCEVRGYWNNGLYASAADAPVTVEGGVYANNNVAGVRLGSGGSSVRDARVVVDAVPDTAPSREWNNMRGVRVCDMPADDDPVVVEGCDVAMTTGRGIGGVVVEADAGRVAVRNTRIRVDDGYEYVSDDGRASFGVYTGAREGCPCTLENVSVTGDASGFAAFRMRRRDSVVERACVYQTGDDRDGFLFVDEGDATAVSASTVNVSGAPFAGRTANVQLSDISTMGECPVPTLSPDTETGTGTDSDAESGTDAETGTGSDADGDAGTGAPTPTTPADLDLSDAPLPPRPAHRDYPVTGTSADNPTVRLYADLRSPATRRFFADAFPALYRDVVLPGTANVEFRCPVGAEGLLPPADADERLQWLLLGVWDKVWDDYWRVFQHAVEHPDAAEVDGFASARDLLEALDVRNYGGVAYASQTEEAYAGLVDETVRAARESGMPALPFVEVGGVAFYADRDPADLVDLVSWALARD